MEYQKLLKAVEPIVRQSGKILLSHFHNGLARNYKGDGSFATQADIESERFLIQNLKELVPGAGFFAEESGKVAGNEFCWVIDPLDGTTNFAQGLPYFCTSVALTKDDIPVLGIIFQPLLNEFFYAIKGEGAFLNEKVLSVSAAQAIDKSLIMFARPYQDQSNYFKAVCHLEQQAYSARTFGAAALDQAYCASGRGDVVLFSDLSWWDVAAGMLLIQEAGGQVSEFDGSPMGPSYQTYIGGNKAICNKIKSVITDL